MNYTGVFDSAAVRSHDHGVTWEVVGNANDKVLDVAYDHVRDRIYAVMKSGGISMIDGPGGEATDITGRIPADQYGTSFQPRTVAVDPVHPEVVYAGQWERSLQDRCVGGPLGGRREDMGGHQPQQADGQRGVRHPRGPGGESGPGPPCHTGIMGRYRLLWQLEDCRSRLH